MIMWHILEVRIEKSFSLIYFHFIVFHTDESPEYFRFSSSECMKNNEEFRAQV